MAIADAQNTAAGIDRREWIREKPVTTKYGLGRSPLKRLREEGKIRFVSLREPGMKQGTLLYHEGSIRSYIEGLEQEQREARAEAPAKGKGKA